MSQTVKNPAAADDLLRACVKAFNNMVRPGKHPEYEVFTDLQLAIQKALRPTEEKPSVKKGVTRE